MKKTEALEELSKCVRCGSCKAFCPTFDEEAVEATAARGRLILLRDFLSGRLKPSPLLNDRIFSCILCGACSSLCPLGLDIDEIIYHGRSQLHKSDRQRNRIRSLMKIFMKRPDLSYKILKMSRHILFPMLLKRGLIPFVPDFPESSFRRDEQVFRVSKKKGRVAVFTGCNINFLFPNLGESLINVLQRFGYEVVLPKGEVCCGTPLRTLGLEQKAEELAKKNLRVFNKLKVDAILSLCPTCTLAIKTEYPKIIGKGLDKAMDISSFFLDKIGVAEKISKTSVYHDPCHLYYGLGIRDEPREIIRKAGLELKEPERIGCCGFGGMFSFSYKEMSAGLLQKRTKAYMNSNADVVVTSCPGCMLQLSRTITDRPVIHLIELIEDACCFRPLKKLEMSDSNDLSA